MNKCFKEMFQEYAFIGYQSTASTGIFIRYAPLLTTYICNYNRYYTKSA